MPQSQVKMDPWASRFGRRGPSHPSTLSPSKGSSPVLTPRRHGQSMDENDLARRYEPAEGSASTSPPLVETPPYLRWAENLHFLLTDPDGVELFEKYLEQENCSHLLKVRPRQLQFFFVFFTHFCFMHCSFGLPVKASNETGQKIPKKLSKSSKSFTKSTSGLKGSMCQN